MLDGKLLRKWKLAGEHGYMSLVRGPDHGGPTGHAISDRLRVADRIATALIKHKLLRSIMVINPIYRCPTVVVAERFGREFVSLFALARQRRRHFIVVKKELQHAGVEPVFNRRMIGATFYRRADTTAE